MSLPDYYRVLGIGEKAGQDEIRHAHRILAKKYHPDVYSGADACEKIACINAAYRTLINPASRKRYDLLRKYGIATPARKTHPRDPRAYNYEAAERIRKQREACEIPKPDNRKKFNRFIFYSILLIILAGMGLGITDLLLNFRAGGMIAAIIMLAILLYGLRVIKKDKRSRADVYQKKRNPDLKHFY